MGSRDLGGDYDRLPGGEFDDIGTAGGADDQAGQPRSASAYADPRNGERLVAMCPKCSSQLLIPPGVPTVACGSCGQAISPVINGEYGNASAPAPAPAPGSTNFRTGAVIRGVERVAPSAFEHVCSLCARREGVTASCGWPGCATQVHPLCARRQGWLLSDVFRQEDERRVFCGRHSVAERRRIENGLGPVGARGGGGRFDAGGDPDNVRARGPRRRRRDGLRCGARVLLALRRRRARQGRVSATRGRRWNRGRILCSRR
mmetsp:Transcript_6850/g.28016  ORF Transcript_6850/g.28016 Transcript_6850/m.28016 type:complete len:260 (-) Transcript_6850:1043-1822(-)